MQKPKGLILIAALLFWGASPARGELLEGSLQLEQRLPELNENFSLSAIKANTEDDTWFEIPEWLAGEWSVDSSRIIEGKFPNEFLDEKEIFGHQRDKIGNIWTSSEDTLLLANPDEKKFEVIRVYSPIEVSNDRAILKMSNTIVFKNSSNKVIAVKRSEAIKRIFKGAFDRISVFTDLQSYDERGFKTTHGKLAELRRLDNEFQTHDDMGGKSLKSSFHKYLLKNGKLEIQK